ncbi:MAG: aminoacyl-tRNA hydrolase [Desulfobacteraceae bacterium]|nr:aminoacyl-tRNA hydrolase [Desulfobacteraceae bacterium]
MINIKKGLEVPENELVFTASGAGGPGGQHVNKSSTRVTLWFDVKNSPSLSKKQKKLISEKLSTRINKAGVLHISARKHRSQAANREQAVEKFIQLLGEALKQPPERKRTRPPQRAKKIRLEEKKRRARKKQLRSKLRNGQND